MKIKKKISIIGIVGLPPQYGGFETLADNLSARHESNWSDSIRLTVYCTSKVYKEKLKKYRDTDLKYISCSANGIYSVLYDTKCMLQSALNKEDVILILGVSGCIFLPIFRLISKSKVIVNIDGLEWRRAKWGVFAKCFLQISEKFAIRYSDVVICDNQAISDYIERKYSISCINIAYGGDHVNLVDKVDAPSFLPKKYYFTVCRIEPENNIHLILEAFSKSPIRCIVFVGNWDVSEYGRRLQKEYSGYGNIYMLDPIYDMKILQSIRRSAIAYIHGHSAGGTNPSLVEAMYTGLPVISFDCAFNKYTTNMECFYFRNANELVNLLDELSEENLRLCAERMFSIAKDKFTWEHITDQYYSLW